MGQNMQEIKTGVVVFATDDTKEGILDARAWLKEKKLTPDQVRLYRHEGMTLVETLKPISIAPRAPDTKAAL
jgi:hypothetical protein